MDIARSLALRTRGFLAINLPAPAPRHNGWFAWLTAPPDGDISEATWFIDGSAVDGPHNATISFGFGIAVIASNGQLLAYGWGAPPEWITDVPGTEGWALHIVARSNPAMPKVITDCLGLVVALGKGPHDAARACRPLARLWGMIFACTETIVPTYTEADRVVWMPSHCTRAAAGQRIKSNGLPITQLEWRGNRLVDHLAKAAALLGRAPGSTRQELGLAARAVAHCAALVGMTSWAANNCPYTTTRADGTVVTQLRRDSEPPQSVKVGSPTGTGTKHGEGVAKVIVKKSVNSLPTPSPTCRAVATASAAAARTEAELLADARFQRSWIRDMAAKDLKPRAGPTAAERLDQLRRRVLARHDN